MYPATETVSPLSLEELERLTSTWCWSRFFFVALLLIHLPGPEVRQSRKLKTNIFIDSMGVTRGARYCRRLSGVSSKDGMFGVLDPFIHGKRVASVAVASM